jgi:branched-chain amino acid transport system ATP-binding protein
MLEVNNLSAGYSVENMILEKVNFAVGKDEVVVIIGQNGSGKSTLVKSVLRMTPYNSGQVYFNGEDITKLKTSKIHGKGIGYFMQGGRVFNHLTIEENLKYAAGVMKLADFRRRVKDLKESFEVINSGNPGSVAGSLSGGEKHQLALAMVLMRRPEILILDEPSAGLSPSNVKRLYETLNQVKKTEVKSFLVIEQNVAAGVEFGDRVLLLQDKKILREELCGNLNSLDSIDEFFFGELQKKE